jgi:TonB-dependent SusC/RagA subfamily outer membrane receptor
MVHYTPSLKLLPLLVAGSLHAAQAQSPVVAMLEPAQNAESSTSRAAERGTSLESLLQDWKKAHHVFFVYRSEVVRNRFVNLSTRTFKTWEEQLTYAVTASGLRVEKTDHNVYVISQPKLPGPEPQTIGAAEPAAPQPTSTGATAASPVTGRVTGPDGAAIPGVTVLVKGTTNGTTTDVEGNFSLNLADANATLVVSAIGFVTQEIAVQGRTQLAVTLAADVQNLNDVVVLGYTTERKADLTGAVAQVNQRDISGLPVTTPAQILQGKAAGVAITAATGAPGENIAVRIRGVGTINDNNPLYIIDGVPTKDGINQISPNDIESINILKDASSAAIYGARASNGVVVVTTKRGKSGKARLSLSAYSGVQTAANLIKMANTPQSKSM